jgi:tellurium resistance protein TerD
MATANLRKGQRVELAKGLKKLRIELTWQASRKAEAWDLDIMGIELDDDQLLCKDDVRRFVFYGNEKLSDPEGALVHSGDDRTGEGDGEEMILNLDKLNPDVKEIMFILNIFESMKNNQNFGEIKNIVMRIYYDNNSIPDLVYDLESEESYKTATVLKVCSIYKTGGIWKYKAINEGVTGTLTSVLRNYGLDSNDNTI